MSTHNHPKITEPHNHHVYSLM